MDVDAQMADGSNCSLKSRARSESNQIHPQIPKEKAKLIDLPRQTSDEHVAFEFNTEWAYDFLNNKGETVKVQKAQYAYYKWNEELKESRLLESMKKADISELWTGVYQIIGFYSVFQGVIYQGVTAMSSVLSCGFYKIPVILSVLASAATILGIYMKLTSVLDLSESRYQDSTHGMRLLTKIMACHKIDVKEFSIDKVEKIFSESDTSIAYVANDYEQTLQKARYLKWAVLVFLTVFSTMFSYLDYIVMCRGYF